MQVLGYNAFKIQVVNLNLILNKYTLTFGYMIISGIQINYSTKILEYNEMCIHLVLYLIMALNFFYEISMHLFLDTYQHICFMGYICLSFSRFDILF